MLSPTFGVNSCKLFLVVFIVYTASVECTVDLGLQVLTGSRCRVGTVFRPASCTRCVCGLFNLMLCRQSCVPTDGDQSTTHRPPVTTACLCQRQRPTGPTTVPILIPSVASIFIRQPFSLQTNGSDAWNTYLQQNAHP